MHIKIAMTVINSLLLSRLMKFKNHYTGKKIEKKSTVGSVEVTSVFHNIGIR